MMRFAALISTSTVIFSRSTRSSCLSLSSSIYILTMYPPSRGMISTLPSLMDWIAAFNRMSGKSVTARISMTPQA